MPTPSDSVSSPAPSESSDRLSEIARRERQLDLRELKAMARDKLGKKGLSSDLIAFLDFTDRDACLASLDRLEAAFTREVSRRVSERLNTPTRLPAARTPVDEDTLTDQEYYTLHHPKITFS